MAVLPRARQKLPPFTRATSSTEVSPASIRSMPESCKDFMPELKASSFSAASSITAARNNRLLCSDSSQICAIGKRPRKPVPLQSSQPEDRNNDFELGRSVLNKRSFSSNSVSGTSALQLWQSFLTKRWLITNRTASAIKVGLTPRSVKRLMLLSASMVCRVDSTRCPVSAARMASSAVSESLISPTRMTSGSCLSIDRRTAGKVNPWAGLTLVCETPVILISTGSSTDRMLAASWLS